MAREFIITGPLRVNGIEPGGIVDAKDLSDEAHLTQIGWIVKAPSTKQARKAGEGVVQSLVAEEADPTTSTETDS